MSHNRESSEEFSVFQSIGTDLRIKNERPKTIAGFSEIAIWVPTLFLNKVHS